MVNGFVFYIKFGHMNKSFWKKKGDLPNPTNRSSIENLNFCGTVSMLFHQVTNVLISRKQLE